MKNDEINPEELFEKNQKLVHYVVKNKVKYTNLYSGYEYDDFVQIGNIGLWKACITYKSEKSKFSTYACMVIYNEIMMEFRKIKRSRLLNESISIYSETVEGEKCTYEDIIEDPHSDIDYLVNNESTISLDSFYELLSEKERKILKLRYEGLRQKEISIIIGYSQSYITRILAKISKKFKKWNKERK